MLSKPLILRNKVVFPDPLGPSMDKNSPFCNFEINSTEVLLVPPLEGFF